MPKRRQPSSVGGNVQKSPSSKAAAILTRGAYSQYVSTAQWRERRWRLFSTFPDGKEVKAKLSGRMHRFHIRAIMIGGVTARPSSHDAFHGFIFNREKLGHRESPGVSRGS